MSAAHRSPTSLARFAFLAAMRTAVTGVHVVTTDGGGGRFGLTVSAMSSVSADPPMLLVCIRSRSPIVEAIAVNSALAVNTLAHDQLSVADTFAGRAHGCAPYDFGCADWETDARKPPLLVGAASRFSCAPSRTVAAGSHTIVIARVLHADTTSAAALAYTGSDYVRTERAAA